MRLWLTGGGGQVISVSSPLRGTSQIVGRSKDTIVLASGENVEPVPIEDRLRQSPLIDQVVVVGQDQRQLGVFIVPDRDGLAAAGLSDSDAVAAAVRLEVQQLVSARTGFKRFELVGPIHMLEQPLQVGRELTNLMKLRRHVIAELHADAIAALYAEAP